MRKVNLPRKNESILVLTKRRLTRTAYALPLLLAAQFTELPASGGGVDLHAHLFMKPGLGWLFRGDFNEPLQANDWESRFSSQVNEEALIQSNLDIVIASLYAHPLLIGSPRQSIRAQINLARQFVRAHPNWILATHPHEAQQALKEGKKVLLLSLEGASEVLDSENDLVEFIDQGGIRMVTFLHITDDKLGGAAFLKGFRALANPLSFIQSLLYPVKKEGILLNPKGLSPLGHQLLKSLILRKVWIDLTHASDAAQQELIPILKQAGQPLLYTHTSLRRYLHAERGISDSQLKDVAESNGVLGLIPSEDLLYGTPASLTENSTADCQGSVEALTFQIKEASKILNPLSIQLGSDFNGAVTHLRPSCKTSNESFDRKGFWNLGQFPLLWRNLENRHAWEPYSEKARTIRFLETWAKLYSQG